MKTQIRLAGVDLAWQSDKNPSAIATGTLSANRLTIDTVSAPIYGLAMVAAVLEPAEGLAGVAIDAPLIIRNARGQRACEREVGVAYGARKAACHPANTTLYPDASSVALSRQLQRRGFAHLEGSQWQIECYPHPALIEIFDLGERLRYKKGSVDEKRAGQVELARLIRLLGNSPVLPLSIAPEPARHLEPDYIQSLRGRLLKNNEDVLDACICLYIAGLHSLGGMGKCFGDVTGGYIWIPQQVCI